MASIQTTLEQELAFQAECAAADWQLCFPALALSDYKQVTAEHLKNAPKDALVAWVKHTYTVTDPLLKKAGEHIWAINCKVSHAKAKIAIENLVL
jgi:hypothetical protein